MAWSRTGVRMSGWVAGGWQEGQDAPCFHMKCPPPERPRLRLLPPFSHRGHRKHTANNNEAPLSAWFVFFCPVFSRTATRLLLCAFGGDASSHSPRPTAATDATAIAAVRRLSCAVGVATLVADGPALILQLSNQGKRRKVDPFLNNREIVPLQAASIERRFHFRRKNI
ncbi:hypothetical protein BC830DRAFT_40296 [Chytriomyces sp. MP71]|nr:hypothetical protein BC830DRAFT_40296 [Chytriomyces sp. MP71]